eukprot:Opistho-2@65638
MFLARAARFVTMAGRSSVVFVLGGPGAGKGTQCSNIVQEFGYVHLSAGDLLREERQSGSADGELIESFIKDGKIVPVEITVNLLKKAMEKSPVKKFLIDGFPRNQNNLEGWEKIMSENAKIEFVLFFECPEQTCIDRALERGKTSGRTDDNIESLRKRFHTYESETKPIITHYEKLGLVRAVSSVPAPEAVFEEVKRLFNSLKN